MVRNLLFVLALVCFGCEQYIELELPPDQKQLVVNSFFNPGSPWNATIIVSRRIHDPTAFEEVKNAVVIVSDGEGFIDTLHHKHAGYYESFQSRPEKNKKYFIRADVPGFARVQAVSSCPESISPTFSKLETIVTEEGSHLQTFFLTIPDRAGKNYYEIIATGEFLTMDRETGEQRPFRYNARVWSDDRGIALDESINSSSFIFTDALFDNHTLSIQVKVMMHNWSLQSGSKLHIAVRTVSEDYFRYKSTVVLQDYTTGEILTQPVTVYNNIENGVGIFAGYDQTNFVFEE